MITLALALLLQEEAAQATKIVEKCWTAVRPSLEKLGVKDLDAAQKAYVKSAAALEKSLANLPKETRDAIEAAADPLAALEEHKQRPPSIERLLPRTEPVPLKEGEGAALLARFAGTWKNEWKAARITTTWKIAADGSVEEEVVRTSKTDSSSIKVALTHELRAKVTRGTTNQDHTFLPAEGGFYLSSNLLYAMHKVTDRKRFTFQSEWDWLVCEDGAVIAIADSGSTAKVDSTWGKDGDNEVLSLKWRQPGKKYDSTRKYVVVGDYLVHSGAQFFKKQ
jgi:hypothetical protein